MILRLPNSTVRRLLLAIYGVGALAALVMAATSGPDARLPWFIVALFSGNSFIEELRATKPAR